MTEGKKGSPARAGKQKKYARAKAENRVEKSMLRGLRRHLARNPHDKVSRSRVDAITTQFPILSIYWQRLQKGV